MLDQGFQMIAHSIDEMDSYFLQNMVLACKNVNFDIWDFYAFVGIRDQYKLQTTVYELYIAFEIKSYHS